MCDKNFRRLKAKIIKKKKCLLKKACGGACNQQVSNIGY